MEGTTPPVSRVPRLSLGSLKATPESGSPPAANACIVSLQAARQPGTGPQTSRIPPVPQTARGVVQRGAGEHQLLPQPLHTARIRPVPPIAFPKVANNRDATPRMPRQPQPPISARGQRAQPVPTAPLSRRASAGRTMRPDRGISMYASGSHKTVEKCRCAWRSASNQAQTSRPET
jgi:hypothetical protein